MDVLVAAFTFINATWVLVQVGGYLRKRMLPPEMQEGFNQRYAVILDNINYTLPQLHEAIRKLDVLYEWHDREDENGVKLWYRNRRQSSQHRRHRLRRAASLPDQMTPL